MICFFFHIGRPRPGSADSRTAWENKAYHHGPDINTVSTEMYGKSKVF